VTDLFVNAEEAVVRPAEMPEHLHIGREKRRMVVKTLIMRMFASMAVSERKTLLSIAAPFSVNA